MEHFNSTTTEKALSLVKRRGVPIDMTMMHVLFVILVAIEGASSLKQNAEGPLRFSLPSSTSGVNGMSEKYKPNTTLSQNLWNLTSDLRQKAMSSKIISGVKSGLLNPVEFGVYLLQDAVWCEKVGDVMKRMADKVGFSDDIRLYSLLLRKANSYHKHAREGYNQWRIADPSSIKETAACQAYHEYEQYVQETMSVGSLIGCMIPCEKLWPWIGQQLSPNGTKSSFGPYTDWVHTNLDPTYTGYQELDDVLDQLHARGEVDRQEAWRAYSNCMIGEVDFFNQ